MVPATEGRFWFSGSPDDGLENGNRRSPPPPKVLRLSLILPPHHPRWHQPIPVPHPITRHALPPHTRRTEEEPPISTQHPTPPVIHHTYARHVSERRLNTHAMGIKGVHDALATRRTKRGNRPRKWTSQGAKAAFGEGSHREFEMTAWTHLAYGEGSCPPLCGPDKE